MSKMLKQLSYESVLNSFDPRAFSDEGKAREAAPPHDAFRNINMALQVISPGLFFHNYPLKKYFFFGNPFIAKQLVVASQQANPK